MLANSLIKQKQLNPHSADYVVPDSVEDSMSDTGQSDDCAEKAVPISPQAQHGPSGTVYYSPPGSPPPIPVYMPHYYHPASNPPPGLGYGGYGGSPPHALYYHPGGSPPQYYQQYYQHPHPTMPPNDMMIRTRSSGSIGSLEGSSPTKRGEARATARISRSSRTKSTTELQDDLKFEPDAAVESLTRTTLMIRNIPNKYQTFEVMALLKSVGLENAFDFLYVPLDFRNAANLGYAFINLMDAKDTLILYNKFAGKRWDDRNSKKVCEISYARVQGREQLIEHFSNAKFPTTSDAKFLPLVFPTRETVTGKQVVDGEPLTIFEFIALREAPKQKKL